MVEDISKNTLLVLVVLTIVVSLLGTWTVINEASKVRVGTASTQPSTPDRSGEAKVTLDIAGDAGRQGAGATGQVTLKIEPERG